MEFEQQNDLDYDSFTSSGSITCHMQCYVRLVEGLSKCLPLLCKLYVNDPAYLQPVQRRRYLVSFVSTILNIECFCQTEFRIVFQAEDVASFSGPVKLFHHSMGKWERTWYLFSCEWNWDRKEGRMALIVRGRTDPRIGKRAQVPGTTRIQLSRRVQMSYTEC